MEGKHINSHWFTYTEHTYSRRQYMGSPATTKNTLTNNKKPTITLNTKTATTAKCWKAIAHYTNIHMLC